MRSILRTEAGYAIASEERPPVLICMGNEPANFSAGWIPVSATKSFSSFVFLGLLHTDGSEACWILDDGGSYVANTIDEMQPTARSALIAEVKVYLDNLINGFFNDVDLFASADVFSLSPEMRMQLLKYSGQPSAPHYSKTDVAQFSSTIIQRKGSSIVLEATHVAAIISVCPEALYLEACRTGEVHWPSPVDGLPVSEVRGFVLSHLMIAWRCVDRRNDLVFFIYSGGFGAASVSLFIPLGNCVVYPSSLEIGQISLASEEAYINTTIDHFLSHGRELLPFLRKPVSRVAHYLWGEGAIHVGHHHWNELPGLEIIVTSLSEEDYPLVYDLAGASGESFYDRIALLFPELSKHIDLSCATFNALSRHAYLRGIQPLRFAATHVSSRVRERISKAIALSDAATEAGRIKAGETGPVVVFGLRVENRTIVDPLLFYSELAKTIAEAYGSLTIVVDGHNAARDKGGGSFPSYLEQRAATRPIDVERRFVADLRETLRKYPIRIINCVGMTLRDNLAWMEIADVCIAPWGAGLAKYRWALNLPSYVLVGNFCRVSKGDINIYTGLPDMEDPSRLSFVSSDLVTDRADLPTLIQMDPIYAPYYVNYDVDPTGSAREVLEFLAETIPLRTAMP